MVNWTLDGSAWHHNYHGYTTSLYLVMDRSVLAKGVILYSREHYDFRFIVHRYHQHKPSILRRGHLYIDHWSEAWV